MNPRRLTSACFAVVALVLVALALIFPLLEMTVDSQSQVIELLSMTAWGYRDGDVPRSGPVNAIPMMFAALLLVVATPLALSAAGSSAAPARRRAAWISLTIAGAFTTAVAMTVVTQVVSWIALIDTTSYEGGPQPTIGWGMWTLAGGAMFAVVAAALAVVPVREPQAVEVPVAPADVEPTGAA
jgi:uncharacterized paraquat-inducible protein A